VAETLLAASRTGDVAAVIAVLALVNGAVGIVIAPHGRLQLALTVTIEGERIAGYELIADPARLRQLDLAVLGLASDRDGRGSAG
jgi:RNA polymerase sigma-70 factor (ECF subfamily)